MATATAQREKPILFSGPMVKAILDGKKTQTRRIVTWHNSTVQGYPAKSYWPNLHFERAVAKEKASAMELIAGKNAPRDVHLSVPFRHPEDKNVPLDDCGWYRVRPVWEAGDKLWVRETWAPCMGGPCEPGNPVLYRADNLPVYDRLAWRPSIHMPRWASRLTLEIKDVRVQRLQEISEADACAEGVERIELAPGPDFGEYKGIRMRGHPKTSTHEYAFRVLWEELNKSRGYGWDQNSFVWAISFEVLK